MSNENDNTENGEQYRVHAIVALASLEFEERNVAFFESVLDMFLQCDVELDAKNVKVFCFFFFLFVFAVELLLIFLLFVQNRIKPHSIYLQLRAT